MAANSSASVTPGVPGGPVPPASITADQVGVTVPVWTAGSEEPLDEVGVLARTGVGYVIGPVRGRRQYPGRGVEAAARWFGWLRGGVAVLTNVVGALDALRADEHYADRPCGITVGRAGLTAGEADISVTGLLRVVPVHAIRAEPRVEALARGYEDVQQGQRI